MPPPPNSLWNENGPQWFFKYTSFQTAKIVLASGRMRWSSPALLNDPFDISFDLHLDMDLTTVRRLAVDRLWADYLDDSQPGPNEKFQAWKDLSKLRCPDLTRVQFEADIAGALERSLQGLEPDAAEMNAELRAVNKRSKILCLSETADNMLLWSHYAQQHYGAVLRFSTAGDDNGFRAARQVAYATKMPTFVGNQEIADMVTGRANIASNTVMQKQIYTKSADWAYEREWRIYFGHGRSPEAPHEDLRYGSEYLDGLIVGCRMSEIDRQELVGLALARNPKVRLFVAIPSRFEFKMTIEEIV